MALRGRPAYVTVRTVAHNRVIYEPGTEFPGPENECSKAELASLLQSGAIREQDQPPRPAPPMVPPVLGDEETPSGDARHVARNA